MKPLRKSPLPKLSRDAYQLRTLAIKFSKSASKVEDSWWHSQLGELLEHLLSQGDEEALTSALDSLYEEELGAHETLADSIEAAAESILISINGKPHTALLFAAPILAWSRYSVPSGPIQDALLKPLSGHLLTHLLANNTKVAVANYLFSPDQLPRSFCETRELLILGADAAKQGKPFSIDLDDLPQTTPFLADIRYLLAVVISPIGNPIFRWQESDGLRDSALHAWKRDGLSTLERLLSGCAYDGQLANAYHAACRQADRAIRPYAIKAAMLFLETVLEILPTEIQATIGPCYEEELVEYRIGLSLLGHSTIYQGVIWPLLGEEDSPEIPREIESALRAVGIREISFLDHPLPMEFCEDCGAPLYPNREAEMLHAEMPESAETGHSLH